MKKIGLLLRVDKFGKYKETRDNIDTRFIYLFQKEKLKFRIQKIFLQLLQDYQLFI